MISKRFIAAALACAFAVPAFAQKEPAEVTDGEIAKYKQLAAGGCREAGEKQGDPKEKTDAFCSCVISTLEKTMKRPEWQQAYFYSLKGEADRERQVLGPHLNNVAACSPQPAAQPQTETPAQSAPQSPAQPAAKPQPKPKLKVQ